MPAELRDQPRWVVWRSEPNPEKPEKPKKPPYRADAPDRLASSTNPATWATFEEAIAVVAAGHADGIGYALHPPYVGVDLDDELPEDDRWAIVNALDSYAERSQSGVGLHVLLRASLNGHGRHPAGIGVFQTDRFLYFTGEHVHGTPTTIEERQAELDMVLAQYLPAAAELCNGIAQFVPVDLDDQELVDKAQNARNGADFTHLWDGNLNGHTSRSEADLDLCGRLAFWTGRDPARIDRLFRSSGLMRDKWLRDDYRERTIEEAIVGCRDVYTPAPSMATQVAKKASAPDAKPVAYAGLRFVPAETFAAVDEPGGETLLGNDADDAILAEGTNVMVYGDGGAGKTTLLIDGGCHLAAGDPWLDIDVARPLRVAVIENEGPRPLFRRKIDRKLAAWAGSPLEGRLQVLDEPWAKLNLRNENHRHALADAIREQQFDVVILGPITTAGMLEAGTIVQVREFEELANEVRDLSGRPVVFLLVHHENKGGQVSGAWEGVGDTLIHVSAQGHGRTRVYFQKTRWSTSFHQTTLQLTWTDGEGFAIADDPERDDNTIADELLTSVLENGGKGWNKIEKTVTGKGERKRQIRDRLISSGALVNAGGKGGMKLWHPDDPACPTVQNELRPDGDAPGTHPASAPAERGHASTASLRPDVVRDAGRRDAPGQPDTEDQTCVQTGCRAPRAADSFYCPAHGGTEDA